MFLVLLFRDKYHKFFVHLFVFSKLFSTSSLLLESGRTTTNHPWDASGARQRKDLASGQGGAARHVTPKVFRAGHQSRWPPGLVTSTGTGTFGSWEESRAAPRLLRAEPTQVGRNSQFSPVNSSLVRWFGEKKRRWPWGRIFSEQAKEGSFTFHPEWETRLLMETLKSSKEITSLGS